MCGVQRAVHCALHRFAAAFLQVLLKNSQIARACLSRHFPDQMSWALQAMQSQSKAYWQQPKPRRPEPECHCYKFCRLDKVRIVMKNRTALHCLKGATTGQIRISGPHDD